MVSPEQLAGVRHDGRPGLEPAGHAEGRAVGELDDDVLGEQVELALAAQEVQHLRGQLLVGGGQRFGIQRFLLLCHGQAPLLPCGRMATPPIS